MKSDSQRGQNGESEVPSRSATGGRSASILRCGCLEAARAKVFPQQGACDSVVQQSTPRGGVFIHEVVTKLCRDVRFTSINGSRPHTH